MGLPPLGVRITRGYSAERDKAHCAALWSVVIER